MGGDNFGILSAVFSVEEPSTRPASRGSAAEHQPDRNGQTLTEE